eukprot:COSAG05_NODE_24472_length_251_cov_0.684211_1_plen_61_part_01
MSFRNIQQVNENAEMVRSPCRPRAPGAVRPHAATHTEREFGVSLAACDCGGRRRLPASAAT